MKCPKPFCEAETKCVDSRPSFGTQRRRRRCPECGYRFTTREVVDGGVDDSIGHAITCLERVKSRLEEEVEHMHKERVKIRRPFRKEGAPN